MQPLPIIIECASEDMQIFNRNGNHDHPLHAALSEMAMASGSDQLSQFRRAIAFNFGHEPRTPKKRQQSFVKFTGKCETAAEFDSRWIQHCNNRIRESAEFDSDDNDENKVRPISEPLVTVFILNGLSQMFTWVAKEIPDDLTGRPQEFRAAVNRFKNYLNKASADGSVAFLSNIMENKAGRREFFEVISTLYDIYCSENPYHPVWLTTRSDFERCPATKAEDRANRWCHFVGVPTK